MNLNGNGHNHTTLANLVIPGVDADQSAYASLLMRLDLYEDTILARKFDKGQPGPIFALDPVDTIAALAGLSISTPLLPRGCLFWQRTGQSERLAIYCEPMIWSVNVALPGENDDAKRKRGKRQRWFVPMPGLVWYGCGQEFRLYAVKEYPGSKETQLWQAPVPNMSANICQGNVKFPAASATTIWDALGLFFESDFNSHLSNGKSKAHPNSVLDMWRKLEEAGAENYPLDDLQSAGSTLGRLMEGNNA